MDNYLVLTFDSKEEKEEFIMRLTLSEDMECELSKYGDNGITNADHIDVRLYSNEPPYGLSFRETGD